MADVNDAGTIQNTSTTDATTSLLNSSTTETQKDTTTQTDQAKATEQTQTQKDAAATAEATKAETKSEETKVGAPEKYEFAVEGVTLNPKAVEAFEPIARELNLTNEQANKLVALQAKVVAEQSQAQTEAWLNTRKEWVSQVKADKEIGGTKLDESMTNAKKIMQKYGDAELTKLTDDYGFGDHPAVIRLLARIGKAHVEDKFVPGTNMASTNFETVMYPTMIKK